MKVTGSIILLLLLVVVSLLTILNLQKCSIDYEPKKEKYIPFY